MSRGWNRRRLSLLLAIAVAAGAAAAWGLTAGTGAARGWTGAVSAVGDGIAPLVRQVSLAGSGAGGCCAWPAAGGFCGVRGTPGGPGAAGPSAVPGDLERSALDQYRADTGDTGPVTVQITNFGCHLQADIYRDGKVVRSYAWGYGGWLPIY